MGLRCYKPRPVSLHRPPQAESALLERLRATFDGLQAMGYDLNRVGFGFADESSPQLSANTNRLWALGKADRVVNTDKARANTFGYKAETIVRRYPIHRQSHLLTFFLNLEHCMLTMKRL